MSKQAPASTLSSRPLLAAAAAAAEAVTAVAAGLCTVFVQEQPAITISSHLQQ
jgi:hypothetical protein